MEPTDDSALLRQYADNHSDEAFAALVARHINLVYSIALRHVGNPQHAEEIAQAVFIILARKSLQLRHDKALSSWLFQATRLTANNFVRSEARRRRREQEARMQSALDESHSDDIWPGIAPMLDAAVAALNQKDRRAIVLRFYEGKNLSEVGAALGASEDAARKRIARALEQLQRFFARRGVDSTTAAIAQTISANSIAVAPAALAKAATAAALAKGAAGSTSTLTLVKGVLKLMAWTKAKIAVVAGAAVILATGTGIIVVKEVDHRPKSVHLAAGALPQTLEELNAWYVEPPAGQNAATFNWEGFKAMQTQGADRDANLPILGRLPPPPPAAPLADAVKTALTAFVQRNRPALQFFAEGAQHDQSRYPIDFTQGQKMQMPHLPKIKSGTQLSELAAILDAENHQGKEAADDVQTALALARSLDAEPTLISQLVGEASVALAVASLEQVVNRTALPPESLAGLSRAFQEMEKYQAQGAGLNRSLIGEKVTVLAALDHANVQDLAAAAAEGSTEAQRQQMVRRLKQTGGMKAERNFLASAFDQLLAAHQEPFPDRLQNADSAQPGMADAANGLLLLNNGWLTGYTNLVKREAVCVANLRLALTAIALEQFRVAHGNRYPDGLSELAPNYLDAPLMDPFDAQPMHYRKQGAGYVLYSIGPDLTDNGGQRMMTGLKGDLVFAVAAPPPQ